MNLSTDVTLSYVTSSPEIYSMRILCLWAGVLEASMATLQEGQLLLERIRKVALCAGVQTRHATTSACHAIERLLQLLQDKWRRLEELWHRRWIQLQQCVQMAQLDQEAAKVSRLRFV